MKVFGCECGWFGINLIFEEMDTGYLTGGYECPRCRNKKLWIYETYPNIPIREFELKND